MEMQVHINTFHAIFCTPKDVKISRFTGQVHIQCSASHKLIYIVFLVDNFSCLRFSNAFCSFSTLFLIISHSYGISGCSSLNLTMSAFRGSPPSTLETCPRKYATTDAVSERDHRVNFRRFFDVFTLQQVRQNHRFKITVNRHTDITGNVRDLKRYGYESRQ